MTAICINFSIVVVYQPPCLWAFCTKVFWSPETIKVFVCGGESYIDLVLHADRAVLCTPISEDCIRICQNKNLCIIICQMEM